MPTGSFLPALARSGQRGGLTLSVLDGLHKGVTAPIDGDACTIGSGSDCDVVLADARIEADHLRLRFHGRHVAVDAHGGDVVVEGRQTVRRGHGFRTALPVTLAVGGARIALRREGASRDSRRAIAGLGVALLAATALLIATQSGGFGVADRARDNAAATSQPASAPVAEAGDAAESLRQRVAAASLPIQIAGKDRHLAASGSITEDQRPAWTEVQRWFDGRFGGRHVLSSTVTTSAAAAAPEFALQAVWFGQNPYVVDARGERRYPGAALQGGWTLKSIEPDGIIVIRDGQEFRLTL